MPISYEFTCPDGHNFSAVAKIRARCPECGKMSRRIYQSKEPTKVTEPQTPSTSIPSSHKVVTRSITKRGLKPDSTSVPVKSPESPTVKDESKSSKKLPPSTKKPIVVKQGMKRQLPKTVKQTASKIAPPKTKSPVKRVTAKRGHTPTVTRPPRGSRERKVVEQTAEVPFWEKVKRQYFR